MAVSSSGPIPDAVAEHVRPRDEQLSDIIYETYFRNGSSISRDFFNVLCDRRLGDGVSRTVYLCRVNPAYVIKFEHKKTFQNVMEWELWKAVEQDHSENSPRHWLAPCELISENGSVLIQRRTRPIRDGEIPPMIPSWVCDASPKNWGMIAGKPVLHDYGYTHFPGSKTLRRLKKNTYPAKPGDFTEHPD